MVRFWNKKEAEEAKKAIQTSPFLPPAEAMRRRLNHYRRLGDNYPFEEKD